MKKIIGITMIGLGILAFILALASSASFEVMKFIYSAVMTICLIVGGVFLTLGLKT